ncbi:MAG TPA: CsbD family protein [Nitrospira sp.]|nr:CsbD family protein [Nitrospira sp.]MBX3371332.1 CsbD family protein [Nitrospira sp.]HNP39101.1 CsbD family protein [Nitrospira sp.]
MNTDQFKGKWVQFKGEVKKQWGKLTDDDLKQVEGDYDKFLGRIQERYGDKKEEVMRWADDWYSRQGQAQQGTQRRETQPPR